MEEKVLQIMPAPPDLRIWLKGVGDKKVKCKPLCLALVKVYPDGENETPYEDIRYVDADDSGYAEFLSGEELEFIGISYEDYEYKEEPMTDEDKRRYEIRERLKYPKR